MDLSTPNWPFLGAIPRPTDAKSESCLLEGSVPVSGVYLLWDSNGQLVYVGQSADIARRLTEHRKEGTKPFLRATFFPVADHSDRLRVESILILCALPPYNRHCTIGIAGGTDPAGVRRAYDYHLRYPTRRAAKEKTGRKTSKRK